MKLEVVYKLKIVERVDSSDYDMENITLDQIREWEAKNLAYLIENPLPGVPGEITGRVEVNVIEG